MWRSAHTHIQHTHTRTTLTLPTQDPPAEIQGTDAKTGDNISYITFVLEPRHYQGEKAEMCINLLEVCVCVSLMCV